MTVAQYHSPLERKQALKKACIITQLSVQREQQRSGNFPDSNSPHCQLLYNRRVAACRQHTHVTLPDPASGQNTARASNSSGPFISVKSADINF
jgi:hypothetical protein